MNQRTHESVEPKMIRDALLRSVFRTLPVPGRYLDSAIKWSHCDLAGISVPQTCSDRWNEFEITVLNPHDLIQKQIYFQGYFEYYESTFLRKVLRPGQTILDVGANIGWHTCLAATKVGPSGRVIACEPARSTYDQLATNVRLNQLTNVELHRVALGEKSGMVDLFQHDDRNCGANTMYASNSKPAIEQVAVQTGDSILEEHQIKVVDLCKIDVEGAEVGVLKGLQHALSAGRIRQLLIEVNDAAQRRAGRSGDELLSILRGYGFRLADLRTAREVARAADLSHGQNVIATLD